MVKTVHFFRLLFQHHSKKKKGLKKKLITNKPPSNSEFGKSIQREKNKRDIRIVTNENKRNKHAFLIRFNNITFVSGN